MNPTNNPIVRLLLLLTWLVSSVDALAVALQTPPKAPISTIPIYGEAVGNLAGKCMSSTVEMDYGESLRI